MNPESLVGARRTAEWRRTLIRDRHTLMNETTFASNASTQLVTEALAAGYG